jgi:hypothetical protein
MSKNLINLLYNLLYKYNFLCSGGTVFKIEIFVDMFAHQVQMLNDIFCHKAKGPFVYLNS